MRRDPATTRFGRRAIGVVGILALTLTGCTSRPERPSEPTSLPAPTPDLAALYNQQPDWHDCGDIQCATIQVPLDWSRPTGPTIGMAISRRPSDQTPEGVIVVNYGGPGVPGAEVLRGNPNFLGRDLLRHYDVVSFDPRGTGDSDPIDCLTNSQLDRYLAFTPPLGSTDGAAETAQASALAAGCQRDDAALLPNLGTTSVVHDLDLLRSVLDQKQLNYLGYSYGTLIGALYADALPDNVGRFVLDGALDPSISYDQLLTGQAAGMEDVLRRYVADCLQDGADCPLSGDLDQAMRQVARLLATITATPLPTGGARQLTGQLAMSGVISALYRESSWPDLTAGLRAARKRDGSRLLVLADRYNDREASGKYSSNIAEAYWAVTCLDYPMLTDPAKIAQRRADIRSVAPTLGPFMDYDPLPCADWPAPVTRTPARVSATGANPILVVGATEDPATPYAMAESLAEQLDSGVLLTRRGIGHASYRQGSTCIDKRVNTFFLDGTPPPVGTTCS